MAKKKLKITAKKRTKSKKSSWKPYVLLALAITIFVVGFMYRENIKFAYFKVRATYVKYSNKHASIQENDKISNVFSKYKNNIFGIDVSHYQGIINWEEVRFIEDSIPIRFAIIRATAGKNKRDNFFIYNWKEAKTNNIPRGAYHYYRPNENSTEQAEFFIKNVVLEKGDIAPILDIEKTSKIQSIADLRKGVKNWLDLVEAHYGTKPILYTGDNFFKTHLQGKEFENYPKWIANYNNHIEEPKLKEWLIWQFSEKGNVKGIGEFVDLNVFDGNEKMLRLLTVE